MASLSWQSSGPKLPPFLEVFRMGHYCKGREWSDGWAFWVNDAQGIPLAKVCGDCRGEKLSGYRPEILTGYDQSDVDEPIDPEDLYDW